MYMNFHNPARENVLNASRCGANSVSDNPAQLSHGFSLFSGNDMVVAEFRSL